MLRQEQHLYIHRHPSLIGFDMPLLRSFRLFGHFMAIKIPLLRSFFRLVFKWTHVRPFKGHSLQIAFAAGAASRLAGCLSERSLVQLLLFVSPVSLGDPLPSLRGVIQRRFRLGLPRKHRGDANIEFVPIFGGSRDT